MRIPRKLKKQFKKDYIALLGGTVLASGNVTSNFKRAQGRVYRAMTLTAEKTEAGRDYVFGKRRLHYFTPFTLPSKRRSKKLHPLGRMWVENTPEFGWTFYCEKQPGYPQTVRGLEEAVVRRMFQTMLDRKLGWSYL